MTAHQALAQLQEHVEVAVGEGGHVVTVARGGQPRADAQGRPGEAQRRRHRQLRTTQQTRSALRVPQASVHLTCMSVPGVKQLPGMHASISYVSGDVGRVCAGTWLTVDGHSSLLRPLQERLSAGSGIMGRQPAALPTKRRRRSAHELNAHHLNTDAAARLEPLTLSAWHRECRGRIMVQTRRQACTRPPRVTQHWTSFAQSRCGVP